MEENYSSVSFHEKNQVNYSTETLFTEMYRTMVKCMGNMARQENSNAEKKIQAKYLWILINMSWATLRVNLENSKVEEYDKKFHTEILNIEDAKDRIFELLGWEQKQVLLIRQEYGINDYDNMFTKEGALD